MTLRQGRETEMAAEIIVVDDGEYRWGADRSQLLAALRDQGWQETAPGRWQAPEQEPDEDGEYDLLEAPYTALCRSVRPLAGLGPDDVEEVATAVASGDAGVFEFLPAIGAWQGLA